MQRSTAFTITMLAFAAPVSLAQEPVAQKPVPLRDTLSIPVQARPPAGMCRIWIADVPVAQQPAPTDCASAVRNKPARGRVLFGDDYVKRESTSRSLSLPPAKGLSPAASKAKRPSVKPDTVP